MSEVIKMSQEGEIKHIINITYGKTHQSIVLTNEIYSIGRHSANKIVIYHGAISRFHCTILPVKYQGKTQQQLFWIIDGDLKGNRSSNGIFVNGNKALSHELQSGDIIKIGGNQVQVTYKVSSLSDDFSISEANIITDESLDSFTFRQSKDFRQSQTTLINKTNQKDNFFISEILLILQNRKQEINSPFIKVNYQGQIIHSNQAYQKQFILKNHDSYNPLLNQLREAITENGQGYCIREIEYEDRFYVQYAQDNPDTQEIESCIFLRNQSDYFDQTLQENEEKYRAIVRQVSEGILIIDLTTKRIIEANQAYLSIVGYSSQEITTLKLDELVVTDPEINDSIISKVRKNRLNLTQESIHRRCNHTQVDVEVNISVIYYGAREYICYTVRDITERKIAQEMLSYQACHDLLTKLGNRNLFNEQLQKSLARAQRYKAQLAVMFIDLDRFKNINDTLGHDIGDQFLREVGEVLKGCLRTADSISRWGGDEFTILLSEISKPQDVTIVAERILSSFRTPLNIAEYQLYCHLSIGIAIYPQDGDNGETLLKNADIALYRSKDNGGNQYQYYKSSMNQERNILLHLESQLYQAIEKNQLQLYYQPQINIKTGKVVGMEALIRWLHPDLGLISPAQFIPIAEETGFIDTLGEWVLYNACQQNKTWQNLGFSPMVVAVNLSPRQCKSSLISRIENILKETNLSPEYLELEITETSIIANPDLTKMILTELNNMGLLITMDDFGSGYSSVGYLKRFPFHTIKIDQSFVRELKNEPADLAIISAVVTLGKGFNLQVVAEGIENKEQAILLRDLQCDIMQGYFFSRPLPVDDATNFIDSAERGEVVLKLF